MRKNRIYTTAAALCMAALTVGCTPSAQPQDKPEPTSDGALTYYELYEGEIRYGVSSELTEYGNDYSSRCFDVNDSDSEIAVLDLPCLHQTAKGYAYDMASIYKEDSSYSDVKLDETGSDDTPSYRITAVMDDGSVMEMNIVQYGDYALFGVMATSAQGDTKCSQEVKKILESVEYSGPPAKKNPELYGNEFFSASVGPVWYIHDDDDEFSENSLTISYNQYDDYRLCTNSFNLATVEDNEDGFDAKTLADAMFMGAYESYDEDSDSMSEPKRTTEKFLGADAEKVTYTVTGNDLSFTRICWFFEVNGQIFKAELSCSSDHIKQYLADLEPVFESIKFN